jgi:hypothetical protein
LAEVLLKSGDLAGAENQLTQAEKTNPPPNEQARQKIQALRDDIQKAKAAPGR